MRGCFPFHAIYCISFHYCLLSPSKRISSAWIGIAFDTPNAQAAAGCNAPI
jgi:hypothetical protein